MRRHREMAGSRVPQSDLFTLPLAVERLDTAVWWTLPEGTQRALTSLLARLLLEHEAKARPGGGRHER